MAYMPLYRSFALFVLVLAIPYVLVAWHILPCQGCRITGNVLLAILALVFATPYVLIALAIVAVVVGSMGVRRGLRTGRLFGFAVGVSILVTGVVIGVSLMTSFGKMRDLHSERDSHIGLMGNFQDGTSTAGALRSVKVPPAFLARDRESERQRFE